MKKALIITYYWPPSGGSGVQRWLKFAKYLPENGWQPVVYTVENGEYPVSDESLNKDVPKEAIVIKQPIREPYTLYKKFTGQKKDAKFGHGFVGAKKQSGLKRLLHNTAVWIRGNFFIPDARVFWVKPSVKYLQAYLEKNPVDVIITTGTPHSLHLIGMKLKEKTGIRWIADFRDPWTGVYYLKDMKLSRRSMEKHKKLEKQVLLNADEIITVGENLKANLAKLVTEKDISPKIHVITNGYDTEETKHSEFTPDKKFTIVYLGLFSKEQNHPALWKALGELAKENKELAADLELKFIGNIDASIEQAIEENGLRSNYNRLPYVKHSEVYALQRSAQVLLLSINNYPNAKEMLTGKIFEYLSAWRPILCIGPRDGDAARIIIRTNSGTVCEWDAKEEIKETVKKYYAAYKENRLTVNPQHIEDYSRKNLTKQLAEILRK